MTADSLRSLGWAAIDWIEHFLVHGPGDVQGQRIELDDEFAGFIVKACRVDRHGKRRIRRAFLSRAKGRSKSGLAAMIECYEALGPCRFDHWAEAGEVSDWGYEYEEGEPVGRPLTYVEILNVATEEGQAGNTYDAVYYMLNPETCSPELLATYGRIDVGLSRINLPDKRGYIEPVSSADSSKDGGKSTFIVADETHLWVLPRLHRLHGVMTRNLLKRKEATGWMLETSTMYAEGEGSVAEGTHAFAESSSRSRVSLLFDHRQADMGWDLSKRSHRVKALREAYGPAASWMDLAALADSWDDPQVSEGDWRRFWLNQPVPLGRPVPSELPNWAVLADAGGVDTATAIGVAMTADRGWCSVGVSTGTHVPMLGISRRDPFGPWVVPFVVELHGATKAPVVIDPKGPARTLIEPLEAAGVRVVPVDFNSFADACDDIFDRVSEFTLRHDSNDDLNAQAQSAKWRVSGDRRVWSRKYPVDALEAVTWAMHGALHHKPSAVPLSAFV
jgi:hypothetical protein